LAFDAGRKINHDVLLTKGDTEMMERLTMTKIRDVLRMQLVGGVSSARKIGRAVGCGKSTAADYLKRAKAGGLVTWQMVEGLDDAQLTNLLFPESVTVKAPATSRPMPDWLHIHEELRRPSVTLALLWSEYKAEHPDDGYQYSQFNELYRQWARKLSVVMRQNHRPGEKTFVDYCDGIAFIDPKTGDRVPTQLFVGTLGASSYTFACATLSQELPVWLDCHCRMYEFFRGVTAITVPDNLKAGVKTPDRYEAEINMSYRELANHYNTCIIPARIRKPRDKGKVEAAVLVAQRWILAALRNRTFYSLQELNGAIAELLVRLNNKTMRHVKKSRRELYEQLDRPALKSLPEARYEFAEWKKCRLNIDYHIEFDDHYYSAPFQLIHEVLWCRAGAQTVEIFHKHRRVASHVRSFVKGNYSTLPEHRPASHRAHAEWTPSRIINWAAQLGPNTGTLVERVIAAKPHPEQGYRSSLGIIRLADKFGKDRVERAAAKALAIGSPSYKTVQTMLLRKMEDVPAQPPGTAASDAKQLDLIAGENIRGGGYYH
jgi:transposase